MNTLWLFNIAMENGPFIDDFPIQTSIYKGFPDGMWVITLNGKSDFVISQPWPALRIPAFILFRSRWTKGGVLLWRKVTWAVAASLLGWRLSSLWDVFTYACRAIRKYRYTSRTCISYILPGKKKSIYHTHTHIYICIYIYHHHHHHHHHDVHIYIYIYCKVYTARLSASRCASIPSNFPIEPRHALWDLALWTRMTAGELTQESVENGRNGWIELKWT